MARCSKPFADLHKSGQPDTMNPNVPRQDVLVGSVSKFDTRYLDTIATEFRDFLDSPTSGSTTIDDKSSLHDEFENLAPLVLDSGIRHTENIHVSNHPTYILEEATTN